MFLFAIELNHVRKPYLEWIEKLRNKYRGYLFHIFNLYLRGTINSEINVFENINTNNFCKGVFRYTSDHITQYTDIEHNKIISFLEELERIFANPENELNEESINNIFKQIKDHKYFENYKHELLYYEGLNYLAKNEFSEAIEKLQIVCKKCTKITAGKTNVRASDLLIVLYLLKGTKTDYIHLNPEIKNIIDSQPQELTLIVFQNPDKAKRYNEVDIEICLRLIEEHILETFPNPEEKKMIKKLFSLKKH